MFSNELMCLFGRQEARIIRLSDFALTYTVNSRFSLLEVTREVGDHN